jgi:hypothetical protein
MRYVLFILLTACSSLPVYVDDPIVYPEEIPKFEARDYPIMWGLGETIPLEQHSKIEYAFEWWNCAMGAKIFMPVGVQDFDYRSGESGVIVMVHWMKHFCAWNPAAAALTHIRERGGRIVHGEISLWQGGKTYAVHLIMIHEAGHLLGLDHVEGLNIMSEYTTGVTDTITPAQIGRVQDLIKANPKIEAYSCE